MGLDTPLRGYSTSKRARQRRQAARGSLTTLSATFSTCLPPASDIGVLVDALLAEPVTITVDGADTVWSNSAGEIVFAPAG